MRGGIIDHRDQIQLLASPFQPVVFPGVPLHQFAIARTPRSPHMGSFHMCPPRPPRLVHSRAKAWPAVSAETVPPLAVLALPAPCDSNVCLGVYAAAHGHHAPASALTAFPPSVR